MTDSGEGITVEYGPAITAHIVFSAGHPDHT